MSVGPPSTPTVFLSSSTLFEERRVLRLLLPVEHSHDPLGALAPDCLNLRLNGLPHNAKTLPDKVQDFLHLALLVRIEVEVLRQVTQ